MANLAYDAYIPRETGVNGFYIRPEDIKTYEQYVSSIEFITDELSKEATLLHVYTENKTWPGNLKLLITNLNSNVDNRGIPDDFGEARLNCQQKCVKNGSCHFCDTAMLFSNRIAKEAYERNNIIPN